MEKPGKKFGSGLRACGPFRLTVYLCVSLVVAGIAPARGEREIEEITVIGVTPTEGVGLDRNKVAANVQTATAEELEETQSLDLSDFMNRRLGSVSINSAQNNPLQPDLQFRGFTASPLLGLPQGLAVYQDGVRVNEPLGDAVNWDLIPASAIHSISLVGGANPVFGLNTLGGALVIDMKNGFNDVGNTAEIYGGSYERVVISGESGANDGTWAYYANVRYFQEDGWREQSDSDALNFYGALSWQDARSSADLSFHYGDTFLTGNQASPLGLLAVDRKDIFTAPDITENDMQMVVFEGTHFMNEDFQIAASGFYRSNKTDSFGGDASDFTACNFGRESLIEGLEEDDLEELGFKTDDVCGGQFADAQALENYLNALLAPGQRRFVIDDLSDELSGAGVIADQAINNLSERNQDSYGSDFEFTLLQDLAGRENQFVAGFAYFEGTTKFNSRVELARLDPVTRSTQGLGTGTFVDEEATDVKTKTRSWSLYFTDTFSITERLYLTLAGRYNDTVVRIADRSGLRPELDGRHGFNRFNPAVGLSFQLKKTMNVYGGYSESARAPTPIELSCNEGVFELARRFALEAGEDPADIDFECRLPNAFLADPPLEQVVAKSFELGVRGLIGTGEYHLGFFHTVNQDDIIFQTTGRTTGLFSNVDETKRLGFESTFAGTWNRLDWYAAYSYISATFEDDFHVLSPNHPSANEAGEIAVHRGDRIPGIPEHQLKIGADLRFDGGLRLGAEMVYNSDQYLRGDESNELDTVDPHALFNMRAAYRFGERLEIFVRIDNVFDTDYENFGLIGEDPTQVIEDLADDSPIFLGAGPGRGAWFGLRISI